MRSLPCAILLLVWLPSSSAEGCVEVTFEQVTQYTPNGDIEVWFSRAFCVPFDEPFVCLTNPSLPCYPQGSDHVFLTVDKFDKFCADGMTAETCVTSVRNRAASDIDVSGTSISTFDGSGVISRNNVTIRAHPVSDQHKHPLYVSGTDSGACHGLKLSVSTITLQDIGSMAAHGCGPAQRTDPVIDFWFTSDHLENVVLKDMYVFDNRADPVPCQLSAADQAEIDKARHIQSVYRGAMSFLSHKTPQAAAAAPKKPAHRHIGLLVHNADTSTQIDHLDVHFAAWHMATSPRIWLNGVMGMENVEVRSSGDDSVYDFAMSPDQGPWPITFFNVTNMQRIRTMTPHEQLCGNCKAQNVAVIVGSAVGGVIVLGILIMLTGEFHKEHENAKQIVHGSANPAFTKSIAQKYSHSVLHHELRSSSHEKGQAVHSTLQA